MPALYSFDSFKISPKIAYSNEKFEEKHDVAIDKVRRSTILELGGKFIWKSTQSLRKLDKFNLDKKFEFSDPRRPDFTN